LAPPSADAACSLPRPQAYRTSQRSLIRNRPRCAAVIERKEKCQENEARKAGSYEESPELGRLSSRQRGRVDTDPSSRKNHSCTRYIKSDSGHGEPPLHHPGPDGLVPVAEDRVMDRTTRIQERNDAFRQPFVGGKGHGGRIRRSVRSPSNRPRAHHHAC
jgi:hypothetical protein